MIGSVGLSRPTEQVESKFLYPTDYCMNHMTVGFTDKNGDFRPTEKMLPVLHSSMLFPENKKQMNEEKKSHLYNFAKKSIFHSGKTYGITKTLAKDGINKINEAKEEKSRIKNMRLAEINDIITVISEDVEKPTSQKISELVRLLNSSSNDMDKETIQRIQFELEILHKSLDKKPSRKTEKNNVKSTDDISEEPEKKSNKEPTVDMLRDEEDDEPLTAQELAILSSIKSQVI